MTKITTPKGWEQTNLSEIAKIYDGTHQTPNYVKSGIPFYSVEHVTSNNFEDTKYIAETVYEKECERTKIEKGDILMTRIGDIGTAKHIDWNIKASFYVTLTLIKCKDGINTKFINYQINSQYFHRELWKRTLHVAFPNKINLGDIGECPILLPPVFEQNRIVTVLETWDQAIKKLNKKIELKKNIKKGLIQRLLIGKVRLPNFNEKWQKVKLGDVVYIESGFGFPINHQGLKNEKYPFLKVSDMNLTGNEIYITRWLNTIPENTLQELKARPFQKNSIIFPKIGAAIATNKKRILTVPSLVDNNVMVITAKENMDPHFFFQWLINFDLSTWSNSGGVPSIRKSSVENFTAIFPSKEEQTAIAEILTTADEEITALEKKRDILEQQKKYLLNNLITGKIRTPENLTLPTK